MAKDKLTEYDATAANNTVVGDVNLAENSALPSDMNNAVREVMSHLKGFASGTDAIDALTVTGAATVNGAFTSPGIDDNADATAITIDSSENVLVGKTSASGSTVGAELRAAGTVIATVDNDYPLFLNRLTSDGDIVQFRKDGTQVGSAGASSGNFYLAGASKGLRFGSGSVVPSSSSGADSDNNFDLGYSSSRFKNLYLSGNLYIGGTGSANALDDYEEGTWTPTVAAGTINSQYAVYTKIGRKVTVSVYIDTFNDRSATNHIIFSGLPFASGTSYAVSSIFGRFVNQGGNSLMGYQPNGSSEVQVYSMVKGGTYQAIGHNDLNSASALMFLTHTYMTA